MDAELAALEQRREKPPISPQQMGLRLKPGGHVIR